MKIAYFVALFLSWHLRGKKNDYKSLKKAMWVAWKRSLKRGHPSFPLLLFHWPLAASFFLSFIFFSGFNLCECDFLLVAAYPSFGSQLLMSHSSLLRLQRVHHTHLCTSHTSRTGNVCFLLRFSLCFPSKAQRRMSSTLVMPDWNVFSMFQWTENRDVISELFESNPGPFVG